MTIDETCARVADELRAVLAVPHSDEFRRNTLSGAKVAISRALVDADLDQITPAMSRYARRRFHATNPGYAARIAAYQRLPETYGELLTWLDARVAPALAEVA